MHNVRSAVPAYSELQLEPPAAANPGPAPIRAIWAGLYRQRFVLLLVFLATLALGALITWRTPRTYTAAAAVQLEQQTPQILSAPDLDPQPDVHDSARFLQTQLDRVRSRALARRVAAKVQATGAGLPEALGVEDGDSRQHNEEVIAALRENVVAELGLNTRLAQISFTSRDPEVSAKVANAFADELAASNLSGKTESSARAEQYLLGQLGDAKSRLEASERRMLRYARAADLTTTVVPGSGPSDQGGSLRAQQLGTLTGSLAEATARRIDAQQRWQQVQGTAPMALPEVQDNRAVQELMGQRAQFEATLAEDRQRHTDDYPTVKATAARIRELNGQIGRLSGDIKQSFEGRYVAAARQEQQLRQTVGGLQGAAMSERERSVGYNSLQREVETNRAFYDGLLQRYKQVAAASGAPASNVQIVDRAEPPLEASGPSVARNLGLAGITGLILAMMLGLVRERMQLVIRSAEDVERNLNVRSLGVIPVFRSGKDGERPLDNPRSPPSEAYFSVAADLQQSGSGALPRTLLIASSTAEEGKSTSAVGLARSLAAMGKRVLLVDGDLRRPSHGELAGDPAAPGLVDVLSGSADPEAAVRRPHDQQFEVLPAGDLQGVAGGLLATKTLGPVLERLSEERDIVIVDGPPIMGIADAVLLAASVDAVVMVVEANKVSIDQLRVAHGRLPAEKVLGCILTKFDPKKAGVEYGDEKYYSY